MSSFKLISTSENATNSFDEHTWDTLSVFVGFGLTVHVYQTGCDLVYHIHDAVGNPVKLISLDLCFEHTLTCQEILEASRTVEECPFN